MPYAATAEGGHQQETMEPATTAVEDGLRERRDDQSLVPVVGEEEEEGVVAESKTSEQQNPGMQLVGQRRSSRPSVRLVHQEELLSFFSVCLISSSMQSASRIAQSIVCWALCLALCNIVSSTLL